MKNYLTIAIKPDTYEHYKNSLKPRGYSWNSIVTEGINAIEDRLNGENKDLKIERLATKLQSVLLELDIFKKKTKLNEMRSELTNEEIESALAHIRELEKHLLQTKTD